MKYKISIGLLYHFPGYCLELEHIDLEVVIEIGCGRDAAVECIGKY
jgi:hypothetical protein